MRRALLMSAIGALITIALLIASYYYRLPAKDKVERNAAQAQEALRRAQRVVTNWQARINPNTGLLPEATDLGIWNPHNAGSDLYPHLLIASHLLDTPLRQTWTSVIEHERQTCGPMPCTVAVATGEIIPTSQADSVFGASEYMKDGLLAATEILGEGPWLDRLNEVADEVVKEAAVETPFGPIPSNNTEANGNLLQVFSRLWWRTGNEEYLTMAQRIADVYLEEVIPKNNGLCPLLWNFAASEPHDPNVCRLEDHGNELLVGLSEVYFIEHETGNPRASHHRQKIEALYQRVQELGQAPEGFWYEEIDVTTQQPKTDIYSDNWGYLLNAYKTVDLTNNETKYNDTIIKTMAAAATMYHSDWSEAMDGPADALESMIYLTAWLNFEKGTTWLDQEMPYLYESQASDGWLDHSRLEGNFVRTALLYALMKTQGSLPHPWREDVALGAHLDKPTDTLTLSLSATKPWEGRIAFDDKRHQSIWRMPRNYPRLNAYPEWFTVTPEAQYQVTVIGEENPQIATGQTLIDGLAISLPSEHLQKRVTIQPLPL